MARRDLAKDATLTLPGITRPVGRPRTGCAKTAAERMRAYRARRDAQACEFPSPVTEIPDEWELPDLRKLERDIRARIAPPVISSAVVQERSALVALFPIYQRNRCGDPYQQHLAAISFDCIRLRLFALGGLASAW